MPGDFAVRLSNSSLAAATGASVEIVVFVDEIRNYTGAATAVFVDGAPPGVAGGCAPFAVPPGASRTLTIDVSPSAAPGNYSFTVRAANGTSNRTAALALRVFGAPPPPDFAIAVSASNLTIARGAMGSISVEARALFGYDGEPLTIVLRGAPAGISGGCIPQPLLVGAACNLTIVVSAFAPTGNHSITLEATNGSAVRTAGLRVTVLPSTNANLSRDFRLEVSDRRPLASPNAPASVRVAVIPLNGSSNLSIAFVLLSPVAGLGGQCAPTFTPDGNCIMVITVANSVAPGSYDVTIRASEGPLVRETNLTVQVVNAPAQSSAPLAALLAITVIASIAIAWIWWRRRGA